MQNWILYPSSNHGFDRWKWIFQEGVNDWKSTFTRSLWHLTSKIFPCRPFIKYIYCIFGYSKFWAWIEWCVLFNKPSLCSKSQFVGSGYFLFSTWRWLQCHHNLHNWLSYFWVPNIFIWVIALKRQLMNPNQGRF